jgi:ATP-dependent helicase/nuclease subunit A
VTRLRDDATEAQVRAADPGSSTWLSANAGSGKTRVLTDRVARLLLQGVDPQRILCLTYTKAAASEMQNRLFQRLGRWAMLDDVALRDELWALGEEAPPDLGRARTLFAAAVETPGGLKIQTIHSFCAGILRRFPLEAGVNPQFKEMEDRAAELLRAEIVDDMALGAEAEAVRDLTGHFTGDVFSRLTAEIVRRQSAFRTPHDWADLARHFGLVPEFGPSQMEAILFSGGERAMLDRLIPALQASGGPDQIIAAKLAQITDLSLPALPVLEEAFLTKAGTPSKRNPNKPVRDAVPEVEAFMERVAATVQARNTLEAARKTHALHRFARVFLPAYAQAKSARGWLDFDDLIARAGQLLTDPSVAQWVLFKLDGGVDHILVDEAQDTSPGQWRVIEQLAQEFTAGEGARDASRTLFVVGDKKQSIYSFQGADPDEFDRMQREFGDKLSHTGRPLASQSLEFSFRSSDAILRVVDRTFAGMHQAGFVRELNHRAFHADKPGRVDLWPLIEPVSDTDDQHWTQPVDRKPVTHHTIQLANAVADRIAAMLDPDAPALIPDREGDGSPWHMRPVRPGDIMVLMQTRRPLFHEIIRACKKRKLPIAGADRLRVGGELAVRDLIALLSFLATPEDSLSLATVLRSPLAGWSEKQLFDLAHDRAETHLWQTLRARRDDFPDTHAMLTDLRGQIDFLRPYDLLERILTRFRGRERLLGRLGQEAADGIDAILAQALAYERSEIPSLTGFLRWAQADDLEIKRQVESGGDLIRVMTVHSAKGLEAPIVILPDCDQRNLNVKDELLETEGPVLWKTGSDTMSEAVEVAMQRRKDIEARERMRLLYVALTRAESWLILAAAGDLNKDGSDWYQTVRAGMQAVGAVDHDFALGRGLRHEFGDWSRARAPAAPATERPPVKLEPFFRQPVTEVPPRADPLSPSDLGGAKALSSETGLPEPIALARGTYVHHLLEMLADADGPPWAALIRSVPVPPELTADLVAGAVAEARRTREEPGLQWIFDTAALSEVSVTARIDGRPLLGTIDRLIVTPERVTAVDYKTNMAVPQRPELCPEGLLRQIP